MNPSPPNSRPTARAIRLAAWVASLLLLLPGQVGWLWLLRGSHGAHVPLLIWGQLVLGSGVIAIWALLRTTPPTAIRLSPRAGLAVVIAGTALLQAAAVAFLDPLAPGGYVDGGPPALSRGLVAVFAVAGVAVLALVLRRQGQSVWWAGLVGFNPLLTLEVGGNGHRDSLGLLLLALTLLAIARSRYRAAAVALGLSCCVKPFGLLLLPFLWRQAHEELSYRAGRRVVAAFALTLAVTVGPASLDQRGWVGWREGIASVSRNSEGNAYLDERFRSAFGIGDQGRQMVRAADTARLLGMLAVLGAGLVLWQTRARVAEAGYWLFMILLLTAPVADPWCLVWPLAFVPVLRGPQGGAAMAWAASSAMAYTAWRSPLVAWVVPDHWLAAEQLPVLCALVLEAFLLARQAPLRRMWIAAPR